MKDVYTDQPPRSKLIKFLANKAFLLPFVSFYQQMKLLVISCLFLKITFIKAWKEINLHPQSGLTCKVVIS